MVDIVAMAPGFGDARRSGVLLEVGRTVSLVVELSLNRVQETVVVEGSVDLVAVDTSRSVVDAVIPAPLIDALPLNGRSFLELSFLVPGNAPAPNFDPTRATSVIVSSAGQLGRGGNIMIDGADNNGRRGRRAAAERAAGRRAGVPDRHEPVHRRGRALGIVGHQRGDAFGQ